MKNEAENNTFEYKSTQRLDRVVGIIAVGCSVAMGLSCIEFAQKSEIQESFITGLASIGFAMSAALNLSKSNQ